MALLNRTQIRDAVRFRGDYQNVRNFPDASLNSEIQIAFGKFYQLVADAHEGYWDTQGTVATVAAQPYVALPSDCWRLQGVDILIGGEYRALRRLGRDQRNRYDSTTDEPVGYRRTARGLELLPTPNAVYTLRVLYTPIAPALADATAREWFNGWEDYTITETLRMLDEREGKPLGPRLAVLERIEKEVRAGANEGDASEPEYLVLREFGNYDPYDDGAL